MIWQKDVTAIILHGGYTMASYKKLYKSQQLENCKSSFRKNVKLIF